MRPNPRTALWLVLTMQPAPIVPPRQTPIDAGIERLARIMGRDATEVESEIHSVIARQFAKGRILPLEVAIRCHGEAQAFYDAFKLEREWPEET